MVAENISVCRCGGSLWDTIRPSLYDGHRAAGGSVGNDWFDLRGILLKKIDF